MGQRKEEVERPWTETTEPPRKAGLYECWWYGRAVIMFWGRSGCWIYKGEPEQPSYWREMKRKPH